MKGNGQILHCYHRVIIANYHRVKITNQRRNKKANAPGTGGADEILGQMRSLAGEGHAHVFLRRTIEGRSALYPV